MSNWYKIIYTQLIKCNRYPCLKQNSTKSHFKTLFYKKIPLLPHNCSYDITLIINCI